MFVQWIYLKYKRKIGVGRMYELLDFEDVEALEYFKEEVQNCNNFYAFVNIDMRSKPHFDDATWFFETESDYKEAAKFFTLSDKYKFTGMACETDQYFIDEVQELRVRLVLGMFSEELIENTVGYIRYTEMFGIIKGTKFLLNCVAQQSTKVLCLKDGYINQKNRKRSTY